MSRARHHFVHQMLSKRFKGSQGLWFFDSRRPCRGVHVRNPDTIFWERGLNTLVHDDGKEDDGAEVVFSSLESSISKLLDFVVDAIRRGDLPTLNGNALAALATFTFQLAKRPIEVRRNRLGIERIRVEIEGSIAKFENRVGRAITDDELAALRDEEWLERVAQFTRVFVSLDPGKHVLPALVNDAGLFYIRAPHAKSFVLGSNPVLRKGGVIGSRDAQIIWPAAPDVAICFGDPSFHNTVRDIAADQLRRFNSDVWLQSDALASDSRQ